MTNARVHHLPPGGEFALEVDTFAPEGSIVSPKQLFGPFGPMVFANVCGTVDAQSAPHNVQAVVLVVVGYVKSRM